MGTLIESFGNLTERLSTEYRKADRRGSAADLFLSSALKSMLPSSVRYGTGTVTDMKDRQAGPFDLVVGTDNFPAFSEGAARTFLADGVIFVMQVRNWAESDLTHFGESARQLKSLERAKKNPIPCVAVSYEPIPLPELSQFLKSASGQNVDGILCIGQHVILRNVSGLYGDPVRVPFVTEQPGPEALKSFMFFLLERTQTAVGLPFGLADYQHL